MASKKNGKVLRTTTIATRNNKEKKLKFRSQSTNSSQTDSQLAAGLFANSQHETLFEHREKYLWIFEKKKKKKKISNGDLKINEEKLLHHTYIIVHYNPSVRITA